MQDLTKGRDRAKLPDGIAIGVLVAAILLAVGDVLAGTRDFFIRDLARFYHPTKHILREILLSGQFPWWNPFYSAGQPLAANPEYAAFYPPQLLILLPDFATGFRLQIVFHLLAGGLGMFLLLRSMRVGRGAAIGGGLSWGIGGLAMSLVNLLPILYCATWIPFILRWTIRFVKRGHPRDGVIAVMFGGLQLLASEPVTLVQTWILGGLWLAWYLWRTRRLVGSRFGLAMAGRFALVLAGAVLLGGVQLLPAIVHASGTVRAKGFDYDLVTSWSLHPLRPAEMFFPSMFGRFDVGGKVLYWAGGHFYARQASPFLFSLSPGIVLALMVLVGLILRLPGWRRYLSAAALFYVLAIGGYTPLYHWAWSAGLARGFRYPEKFSIGLVFVTIVFASTVLDKLARGDASVRRTSRIVAIGVAALAVALAAFAASPAFPGIFARIFGVSSSGFLGEMVESSRDVAVLVGVGWAVLAALLVGVRRGLVWWLVGLLWLELAISGLDVSPRIRADFYDPPPVASRLDPDRGSYRIFHEVDWYGRSKTARSWFSTGDAVYWVVRNGLFPMTPANEGFSTVLERDYDKTAMTRTVDLVRAMFRVRDRGRSDWAAIFMRMSNARYRSRYRGSRAIVPADPRMIDPVSFSDFGPGARYWIADEIRRTDDVDGFVDAIVEDGSAPRTAWLVGSGIERIAPAEGTVEVVSEDYSGGELHVVADSPGLLYLSITYHENFVFTIDGRKVRHFPVNLAYTGVAIPEGSSVVRFRYRDPVVVWSGVTSVLTLCVLGGIMVFRRKA